LISNQKIRKMKLNPNELSENGYQLHDELDHQELVPFIQLYMKKRTAISSIYFAANMLLIVFVGYLFITGFKEPDFNIVERFGQVSIGFLLAFLLLPLHEYIHVLAYKSQGATHTSYDMNLKKFYFMALADRFVANRKEFIIVALAPFLTISVILIFLAMMLHHDTTLLIIAILLAHTAMCSGDFGLLSYFEFHKEKEIVTYDDVEKKVSYFYEKIE